MLKKILVFIALIILLLCLYIAAIIGYEFYQDMYWDSQTELVSVSIEYSEEFCEKSTPLRIIAINGSNHVVNKVEWDIGMLNPGYSTDLVSYGYHEYSFDKILKKSEKWVHCVSIPKNDEPIYVKSFDETKTIYKSLKYIIKNKSVIFDKNA